MKILIYILAAILAISCNKTIDIKSKTIYSNLDHEHSIPTEKLFSKIKVLVQDSLYNSMNLSLSNSLNRYIK